MTGLLLLFVIPLTLATVQQLVSVSGWKDAWWRARHRQCSAYDPTPTAWDFSFITSP